MIGVVVVTHGSLASALIEAAEMTLGHQEMVRAVTFSRREGGEDLSSQMARALQDMSSLEDILILTDMKGGSAYNASRMLISDDRRIHLITGANLAVLLEVLILRKNTTDLKEVASLAAKKGRDNIAHIEG